jgi:signal transduction histidine kinase
MLDHYQLPTLVLMLLLTPAFGYLYFRFRDTRTLLWFLGFLFCIVRMLLTYKVGTLRAADIAHPWLAAVGQTSVQIAAALFLASLSSLHFRVGRFQILYVIPYTLPLVLYAILLHGVFHGVAPSGLEFWIFPALGGISLVVGFFWGIAKGGLPSWLSASLCALLGSVGFWLCLARGGTWPLSYVQCINHLLTAGMLVYFFRRFTPGLILSALGFAAWSTYIFNLVPAIGQNPAVWIVFERVNVMGKVVAAMGLILLALEDQLSINQAGRERERRARFELEAYTNLILSRRRVEDFDRQAPEICQTITAYSRFSQAALLLLTGGRYRLAGSSGLDSSIAAALDELAIQVPVETFLASGTAPPAVDQSHTCLLDLTPWLRPGDDLKRLHFTSVLAVPMAGRSITEGALLLSGMRGSPVPPVSGYLPLLEHDRGQDPLRADDLLPIEMLTARLQATRSQTIMLEKLIDSEKFAGLGQLAGSVTEQLNNPLTVILGYASLLEGTSSLDLPERRGIDSILIEARRMRATLESLTRISRSQNGQFTAVSVTEMLRDLELLHRSEFLQRSIDFRLTIAPGLPRVRCHAQQLRQAVLHCLQFAIETVENRNLASRNLFSSSLARQDLGTSSDEVKSVRLEATAEGNRVQILIAHSGAGFLHPDRAFDPFVPAQATGETTGLGLSLCATILRDHNGKASAVNLEPSGAAIILELRAA